MFGRRTWAVVAGAALLALVGTGSAGAQAGESIQRYQSQITIEPSGDLRVVEQITYDFGFSPRHGITRDIPTRFHYNGRYDRLEPVSEVAVTGSAGTPIQTKISNQSGTTHIRVGDANRTISGVHAYTITYRVRRSTCRRRPLSPVRPVSLVSRDRTCRATEVRADPRKLPRSAAGVSFLSGGSFEFESYEDGVTPIAWEVTIRKSRDN